LICLFQSDFVLQFSNAAFDSFFLIDERQPRLLFSDYFHPSQQEELEAQLESLKQGKNSSAFKPFNTINMVKLVNYTGSAIISIPA
jgi:hypothetical protein